MEILNRELIYLWYYFTVQLEQIFVWWVLGMVIGSAVSVFVKDSIHCAFRSLNGKPLGIGGIIAASALGIASPLCMYGTIPIAASISKSGMRDSWLAAFMMSSILLNPQLIVYSAALGGTVWRQRGVGSVDGCHDRRAAVCLRRRDNPAFAAMAVGRHERRERSLLYVDRSCYKNYEFRGIKNCCWIETFCILFPFCNGFFPNNRHCS